MPGRARPEQQPRILAEVLARAAAPGALVVFDLDSTLLDNRPRLARILRELGAALGLPALRGARLDGWAGWSIEALLAAAGLEGAEVARHRAFARAFWAERFFTSEYCRADVPLPGAPAFVRAVAARGARVAYVSGRPAAMRPGTLEVLDRAGFPAPDGDRARLLLNPGLAGDDAWKQDAAARVERAGRVVAAFDNEPAHVNAYARRWPDALCVHLDTDHSDREVAVLHDIPSIEDFRVDAGAPRAAGDLSASAR